MTPWELRTNEFANCNCAWGCPCQFNAPPTHGTCAAVVCNEILEGHYGDVRLDGLRFGGIFSWPGAIHEGSGKAQPIVDARASPGQREAILRITSGEDTAPMATVFAVFASTFTHIFEPIFAEIDFEVDIEARRSRFVVPGRVESFGEPIRNPVTGAEHRARIEMPDGFEYEVAEMGSGNSTTHGTIPLELMNSYGQFARLHMNNHGVIRHRSVEPAQ